MTKRYELERSRTMVIVLVSAFLAFASSREAIAQDAAWIEAWDTSGPVLLLAVEIHSDGTVVRILDDRQTRVAARLDSRERYRLEKFLASPKLQDALEALDRAPGPSYTDGDDVALIVSGERHGYAVGCEPPPDTGRELVDLINEILSAHFGREAQLRLVRAGCDRSG